MQCNPRRFEARQRMEFTPAELWTRVLATARAAVPEQSYRTWLSASSAAGLSDTELIIETPSVFHSEWIEDKYGALLQDAVRQVLGRTVTLRYRSVSGGSSLEGGRAMPGVELTPPATPGSSDEATATSPRSPDTPEDTRRQAGLNERYTFDRFVVGANNQLAAAACRAVGERPGRVYNPLFIYGGVGLGKTHLMHSVGHLALQRVPTARVAYVSTERFMNELVNAIQQGSTAAFRRRFRFIDVLLVDDVHFIAQKESTQEEFFHTFNALYESGKQLVLTSDRPPKELAGVEERLVSRFEWGLVADIKPPDYETRVAILRKKAALDGLVIDSDVLDFVARSCTSSVRELEGAVIKLLAYSSLRNQEITLELSRQALQGVLRGPAGTGSGLTADGIRDAVAVEWGVRSDALSSKRRSREIAEPRQVAMFLIKDILDQPLVRIGRLFGGRDHSTVIHSIRKVEGRIKEDHEFASRIQDLRGRLDGSA